MHSHDITPAVRKVSLKPDRLRFIERDVAAARLAKMCVLYSLVSSTSSGAAVLTGQKVDFHSDLTYPPPKDERLLIILPVSTLNKKFPDRSVASFCQRGVIDSQVDVDAANVCFLRIRNQQLRNPPTDQDQMLAVLAQHQHYFEENRFRRSYLLSVVVALGHHDG